MATLNKERAAMVLVEAFFFGDQQAASRYQLSLATIKNYRTRLNTDKELSSFFHLKKQAFESDWIEEIPAAMRQGIRFLIKSFQESDYTDPQVIHSVAGAMKIMAEIGLTKELLNVKYGNAGLHRENSDLDGQVVFGNPSEAE